VLGALNAAGTAGHPIRIVPATGSTHFGAGESGVVVGDGTNAATLTYSYVAQFGGGILVQVASTATISDTYMAQAAGDFLVTGGTGATLKAQYVQIGTVGLTGMTDTTHCDTHFNGGTLTLENSITSTASFGTMFYGGQSATFTYDNWLNTSGTNVSLNPGVSGDFSNGYFDGMGLPTSLPSGITANNVSTTMLAACDGTNDTTCAGVHADFGTL